MSMSIFIIDTLLVIHCSCGSCMSIYKK